MTQKEKQTEDKIVDAAKDVFLEKGMEGARMQEIADKAGINKSLLHYYFRSKEKLFDFVFSGLLKVIGKRLGEIMQEGVSIEEKVKGFAAVYIDLLMKNPYLPNFIFNEATRNPDRIMQRFASAEITPSKFFAPLENQLQKEGYQILPQEFVLNVISMVIFPIAMRPIVQPIAFDNDKTAYKHFIESRKSSIVLFVMSGLEAFRKEQP